MIVVDKEKAPVRFHPLFEPEDGVSSEDFAPEPFAAILVARLETSGRVRVPRRFSPDELPDLDAVFARFGGGVYELEARRADGTIYARRMRTLPGASKALVDSSTVPDAPAAAAAPTSPERAPLVAGGVDGSPLGMLAGRVDPMVLLLLHMSDQQSRNNATMMQTIVAALAGRPVPPPPPGPDLAGILTGIGSIVGAMKPAAPSPVGEVLQIQKLIREEATAQSDAATRIADARAPEADTAETVAKVVHTVAPLLSLLPKAPGVPPVPTSG